MPVPTLDSQPIFGVAIHMIGPVDNPRSKQNNAYSAISGVESLDLGLRGRFTTVTGILYGGVTGTYADLFAAEQSFRNFNDGLLHILTDQFNVSWVNVKLESFEMIGDIRWMGALGYFRHYSARFEHLT